MTDIIFESGIIGESYDRTIKRLCGALSFVLVLVTNLGYAQEGPQLAQDCRVVRSDCPAIGLRDPVGLGISVGAPSAVWTDVRIAQWPYVRLEVEGSFGAGVARWGMGEGHSADFRIDMQIGDDDMNDALLISPRAGYFEIVGEPSHPSGWLSFKFTPYETVGAIFASCGLVWTHEYAAWSLETSLVPGGGYAITGQDKNNNRASGQFSFLLFTKIATRF